MLKKIEVYSSLQIATDLSFDTDGFAETDFIQVTNIDGIDPVEASIDVVSSGNVDGAIALNTQVPTRNIVLTLRPNPDWKTWSFETLRKVLYSYFIPKSTVKLIFDSDEIGSLVQIYGTVESCASNPFNKDPEYIVSIICSDPYFTLIDPIVVNGVGIELSEWDSAKTTIHVNGNEPIGFILDMPDGVTAGPYIQSGDPTNSIFHIIGSVDGALQVSSIPLHKYIRKIDPTSGMFENILSKLELGSEWPVLLPGNNDFAVMNGGSGAWSVSYYEKYGAL